MRFSFPVAKLNVKSAVVGVPLNADIPDRNEWNDTTRHSATIDVNITLLHTARTAIGSFGILAALGAMTTTKSVRFKLQCALCTAAAVCSSFYYFRLIGIRSDVIHAYSRASNSKVDSARHATWCVANGVLAWVGFLLRGPFDTETVFGVTYSGWLHLGVALSCGSVIFSGAALFCAESARYATNRQSVVSWGFVGLILLVCSSTAAGGTTLAIHSGADRSATRTREDVEISLGRSLGVLWLAYPLVSAVKVLITLFSTHSMASQLESRYGERAHVLVEAGRGMRSAIVWALRAANASHSYQPLPKSIADEYETQIRAGVLVPALYTALLDNLLALVDVVSVGIPCLATVALALPVGN
jgi:hypothetical protein